MSSYSSSKNGETRLFLFLQEKHLLFKTFRRQAIQTQTKHCVEQKACQGCSIWRHQQVLNWILYTINARVCRTFVRLLILASGTFGNASACPDVVSPLWAPPAWVVYCWPEPHHLQPCSADPSAGSASPAGLQRSSDTNTVTWFTGLHHRTGAPLCSPVNSHGGLPVSSRWCCWALQLWRCRWRPCSASLWAPSSHCGNGWGGLGSTGTNSCSRLDDSPTLE